MTINLGILTTHPIQYQVPWFRALAARSEIDLTVFFAMIPDDKQQGEGFGVSFKWDLPLLGGYKYKVLENVSRQPSVTTFAGCDTPGIAAVVREEGFDAFIVNGWVAKSCIQLLAACRRYGLPCIVRGESNWMRPRALWKSWLHRLLLKQYAAFLAIGKSNRDFYLRNGVPPDRIFFAPYCIENERFKSHAEALRPQRGEIRKGFGIPADAFVFLFCAKFIEKKKPIDVLRALNVQRSRFNDRGSTFYVQRPTGIHLLMVGDGELRGECERYTEEHRLPVTFAGFLNQTEIVRAYVASDCLVLPSDYGETWGLVVNEAMACGLPAIVSDRVGCHPDLILPDQTDAVFPFANTDALAETMHSFASQPEYAKRMGENVKKLVFAKYNYDEVVKGTMEALKYIEKLKNPK